jgi:hypothetical protein
VSAMTVDFVELVMVVDGADEKFEGRMVEVGKVF